MDIKIGDAITWVRKSRRGTTLEFRMVDDKVVEVHSEHVVTKAKNGRRKRVMFGSIVRVNGVAVEKEAPEQTGDEADDLVLRDILSLVMSAPPSTDEVGSWTSEERAEVAAWAAAEMYCASDNPTTRFPRPDVLKPTL